MYAMQYEITVPADYDMNILRARVAAARHVLDDRPGLGLKAYVIRERRVDGSPVNQYAPFYLWNDPGAMSHFLFGGGGFERIIRSFGRPAVLQWTGVASVAGPARGTTPKAASRRLTALPVDPDLGDTGLGLAARIEQECKELEALAQVEGVHTAALAVDPQRWQLLKFVLWADSVPQDNDATEWYEVLHVSSPGLAELPNGRHW
ncbi:MAG: hypothetical protein JWQ81_7667 [Amycolatopsis sp.]|uniref:DUF4865 family protein n=1 Tax=Amycolatopsis sp. TaxID=37632 RepID=UPI0026037BF9|nr:DUF4865 family protein [Amycolatopsis sp.]MCU1686928.1 hypothetical protein [Amycolatopsis sp.]